MKKTHLLFRVLTINLAAVLALTACGIQASQPVVNTPQPSTQPSQTADLATMQPPTQPPAQKAAEPQFL